MKLKLTKKQQKLLFYLLIMLLVSLVNYFSDGTLVSTESVPEPGYYSVLRVSDGDTIVVDMNGSAETIRFIGVDTPETHHPSKPVQCFGEAASQFTRKLIGDRNVRLEADELNSNRDRYDRLLRYVYLPDGTMVNLEIVKSGYGFALTSFPMTKVETFEAAEKQAEESQAGLWGGCQLIETPNGFETEPA